MDPLRVVLLICGVTIIAGIYVWEWRRRRREGRERLDDYDWPAEREEEALEDRTLDLDGLALQRRLDDMASQDRDGKSRIVKPKPLGDYDIDRDAGEVAVVVRRRSRPAGSAGPADSDQEWELHEDGEFRKDVPEGLPLDLSADFPEDFSAHADPLLDYESRSHRTSQAVASAAPEFTDTEPESLESPSPGPSSLELFPPEPMTPKSMDPESMDPESMDPGSMDPGSMDPESMGPESMDPELIDLGEPELPPTFGPPAPNSGLEASGLEASGLEPSEVADPSGPAEGDREGAFPVFEHSPDQLDLSGLSGIVPGDYRPRGASYGAKDPTKEPATSGATAPQRDPRKKGPQSSARARGEPPSEPSGEPSGGGQSGQQPGLIMVLTVMAREGEPMAGDELSRAMAEAGLAFGDMGLFHRLDERSGESVFSVANVVKPGSFELHRMAHLSTPGLALFARFPGPMSPLEAFEAMLKAGWQLADRLQARLCDEARSALTPQSINHLRERVAEYQRRERLR